MSKKTHKFGIGMPMSIDHAKQFDAKSVDMLWKISLQNRCTKFR